MMDGVANVVVGARRLARAALDHLDGLGDLKLFEQPLLLGEREIAQSNGGASSAVVEILSPSLGQTGELLESKSVRV